ncbi:MAG: zinc-dependent metalloprotease [Actinomycetota bacterium]|nr:zinc-dependent metalloprotease [Actinomycetota bacterium]
MSEFKFGFNLPDPDDRDKNNDPAKGGGSENPADAFGQLGEMLSQLGQMLSQAGSSTGPVNYDLAKQIAMQKLTGQMGFSASDSTKAVTEAVHLAEMWLDPVTTLPAGATSTKAWTPRDWVEHTLPTWQRLCDPVARRMSGAWVDALPAEAKQQAGPLLAMVGQMGGMAFGSQLGNALAQLAAEVLTSTDIGLPLGPPATAALLPATIEEFTKGLERPSSEVMVFLAAREAAHQRLFAHVPWLRQRLLATVEEFANGITVDTTALEELASQVDPSNPETIEKAMQSGVLEPQTTPEQKAALARLETLLALVEGWVDIVVGEAVTERLPGAEALRETLRRKRASGGPAEQTFATLVGLELRPRRLRAAASLWRLLTDRHGIEIRDGLWAHPDLMPTAADLDDPLEFADRVGSKSDLDDDPIAQLKRTEQSEESKDAEKKTDD